MGTPQEVEDGSACITCKHYGLDWCEEPCSQCLHGSPSSGILKWEPKSDSSKDNDPVNHPAHYNNYPKEVKDIIRFILGDEGYRFYCMGNELKYRLRAGLKDPSKLTEDMLKAEFYRKERMDV